MTLPATVPNEALALQLLADGHDVRALRRFAGFPSLRTARDFARDPDNRDEVKRLVADRIARLGAKAIAKLGELLDSRTTDGRTIVAASRTLMEAAGHFRHDQQVPVKRMTELNGEELSEMIRRTKAELAERQARREASSRD